MIRISIAKNDLRNFYKGKSIKVDISEIESTKTCEDSIFYSNEGLLSDILKEIIEAKKGA